VTTTEPGLEVQRGTVPNTLPRLPVKETVALAPDCVVECRVFSWGPDLVIDAHDPVYATCARLLSSKAPFDIYFKTQGASVAPASDFSRVNVVAG